jgi:hypothetical protein
MIGRLPHYTPLLGFLIQDGSRFATPFDGAKPLSIRAELNQSRGMNERQHGNQRRRDNGARFCTQPPTTLSILLIALSARNG